MNENSSKKLTRSRNEKIEQKSSSSVKQRGKKMSEKNDVEIAAASQVTTSRLRSRSRPSPQQNDDSSQTPIISGRSTRASVNGRSPSRKRIRRSHLEDQTPSREQSADLKKGATPDIPSRCINGQIVDSHCWVCHRLTSEYKCDDCPRVYHSDCLKKLKLVDKIDCECKIKTVGDRSKNVSFHPVQLRDLLMFATKEAFKEKKNLSKRNQEENNTLSSYFTKWPSLAMNSTLCKVVDLLYLVDKINSAPPYSSTGEFFMDVKWMYHNSHVVYGADSEVTHTAHTLVKKFKLELLDLEACQECYFNRHTESSFHDNSFTKVCRNPHKIVWAKLRGSPFWPAKCLKIDKTHAEVWFFGTHDKARVMLNQVRNISRKSPNKVIGQHKYRDAMAELDMYIANYKAKFGDFEYPEESTPINDAYSKTPRGKTKKGRHRQWLSQATSGDESADENEMLPDGNKQEKSSLSKATHKESEPLPQTSEEEDIIQGTPQKKSLKVLKALQSDPQKKPQLNLSVLHEGSYEDFAESKEHLRQAFINISEKLADNSGEKVKISSQSEDNFSEPNLVCHMTFTADEENCTNENMSVEISESQVATSQPEKLSDTNSVPSNVLFENNSDIIIKKLDHSPTNSSSSSRLPVITSPTSPCVITATHSTYMDHMSVPSHAASEKSPSAIPEIPIKEVKNSCSTFAANANNKNHLPSEMADHLSQTNDEDDDDDDEIVIEKETCKTNPIRESFLRNEINAKAMNELMLSCRPSMKIHLQRLVNTVVEHYLSLYLDFHRHPLEKNDFKTFITVYKKLVKKIEHHKLENQLLKSDVTKLQEKVKNMNDIEVQKKCFEIQNLKLQNKVDELQSKVNDLIVKEDLRKRLKSDIINATKRKISLQNGSSQNDQIKDLEEKIVQAKKSEEQLKEKSEILKSENEVLKSENEVLKSENEVLKSENEILKSENEVLKSKLCEYEDKIKELQLYKEETINKNLCQQNSKVNVECQTNTFIETFGVELDGADGVSYNKHEISELNFSSLNDPVQYSLQQPMLTDVQHKGMLVIQQSDMAPILSSTSVTETVMCESSNLIMTESTFVGQPVLPPFPLIVSANPIMHPSSNSTFLASEESMQQHSSSSTVTKSKQTKKSLPRNPAKNSKRQKK